MEQPRMADFQGVEIRAVSILDGADSGTEAPRKYHEMIRSRGTTEAKDSSEPMDVDSTYGSAAHPSSTRAPDESSVGEARGRENSVPENGRSPILGDECWSTGRPSWPANWESGYETDATIDLELDCHRSTSHRLPFEARKVLMKWLETSQAPDMPTQPSNEDIEHIARAQRLPIQAVVGWLRSKTRRIIETGTRCPEEVSSQPAQPALPHSNHLVDLAPRQEQYPTSPRTHPPRPIGRHPHSSSRCSHCSYQTSALIRNSMGHLICSRCALSSPLDNDNNNAASPPNSLATKEVDGESQSLVEASDEKKLNPHDSKSSSTTCPPNYETALADIMSLLESHDSEILGPLITSNNRQLLARVMNGLKKMLGFDSQSFFGSEQADGSVNEFDSEYSESYTSSHGNRHFTGSSQTGSNPSDASEREKGASTQTALNMPGHSRRGHPSGLRSRASKRRAESDDDEKEEGSKRPKVDNPQGQGGSARNFACPYYKRNPVSTRRTSCRTPGFPTVHRMKEHLYRHHALPTFQCHICYGSFRNSRELTEHLRPTSGDSQCPGSREQTLVGFTPEQEKELRQREENISEVERWRKIWRILFQEDEEALDNIPSPYCDDTGSAAAPPLAAPRSPDSAAFARFDRENRERLFREVFQFIREEMAMEESFQRERWNSRLPEIIRLFQEQRPSPSPRGANQTPFEELFRGTPALHSEQSTLGSSRAATAAPSHGLDSMYTPAPAYNPVASSMHLTQSPQLSRARQRLLSVSLNSDSGYRSQSDMTPSHSDPPNSLPVRSGRPQAPNTDLNPSFGLGIGNQGAHSWVLAAGIGQQPDWQSAPQSPTAPVATNPVAYHYPPTSSMGLNDTSASVIPSFNMNSTDVSIAMTSEIEPFSRFSGHSLEILEQPPGAQVVGHNNPSGLVPDAGETVHADFPDLMPDDDFFYWSPWDTPVGPATLYPVVYQITTPMGPSPMNQDQDSQLPTGKSPSDCGETSKTLLDGDQHGGIQKKCEKKSQRALSSEINAGVDTDEPSKASPLSLVESVESHLRAHTSNSKHDQNIFLVIQALRDVFREDISESGTLNESNSSFSDNFMSFGSDDDYSSTSNYTEYGDRTRDTWTGQHPSDGDSQPSSRQEEQVPESVESSHGNGSESRTSPGKGKKRQRNCDRSDDGDGNPLKPKRTKNFCKEGDKRFACPYWKRDPSSTAIVTACIMPGFNSIDKLKNHLHRCHELPGHPCYVYFTCFETPRQAQEHLRENSCSENGERQIGYTPEQRTRIYSLGRRLDDECKWRAIWDILFEDDSEAPHSSTVSPYCGDAINMGFHIIRRYVENNLSGQHLRVVQDLLRQLNESLQNPPQGLGSDEYVILTPLTSSGVHGDQDGSRTTLEQVSEPLDDPSSGSANANSLAFHHLLGPWAGTSGSSAPVHQSLHSSLEERDTVLDPGLEAASASQHQRSETLETTNEHVAGSTNPSNAVPAIESIASGGTQIPSNSEFEDLFFDGSLEWERTLPQI